MKRPNKIFFFLSIFSILFSSFTNANHNIPLNKQFSYSHDLSPAGTEFNLSQLAGGLKSGFDIYFKEDSEIAIIIRQSDENEVVCLVRIYGPITKFVKLNRQDTANILTFKITDKLVFVDDEENNCEKSTLPVGHIQSTHISYFEKDRVLLFHDIVTKEKIDSRAGFYVFLEKKLNEEIEVGSVFTQVHIAAD